MLVFGGLARQLASRPDTAVTEKPQGTTHGQIRATRLGNPVGLRSVAAPVFAVIPADWGGRNSNFQGWEAPLYDPTSFPRSGCERAREKQPRQGGKKIVDKPNLYAKNKVETAEPQGDQRKSLRPSPPMNIA